VAIVGVGRKRSRPSIGSSAELGRGGMGGRLPSRLVSGPLSFNKLVVVKRIRSTLADEPDFLSMFHG